MDKQERRNNPGEMTSCITFCPVEIEIWDPGFLLQPKNGTTSEDHRDKVIKFYVAILQCSSAPGFQEQLCFCCPGRATVKFLVT